MIGTSNTLWALWAYDADLSVFSWRQLSILAILTILSVVTIIARLSSGPFGAGGSKEVSS